MQRALELCREYAGRPDIPRILATAGIHPHEAQLADEAAYCKLDALLGEPEVARGRGDRLGLLLRSFAAREATRKCFCARWKSPRRTKRPIIIHCRPSDGSTNAWDDTLATIEAQWASTGLGGILHCFTGELDHARRALDCGFLISFAGNITFPKAEGIRAAAAKVPLDRMLIETDAPFLAPGAPPRQKE